MNIELTKNIFGALNIPESRLMGVFEPNSFVGRPGLSDRDIEERFRSPLGTPPIREMAKSARNVLIITDDNTRPTPLPKLLPPLLKELKDAGISDEAITFLIGLGTHRAMTQQELRAKFGTEIAAHHRIVNHSWDRPEALVSLGQCSLGFDVVVNRLVQDADFILSVGNIVPHATTGFSAGPKTVMPGICGENTIEDTHWKALDYKMNHILGVFDNPVRQAALDVGRMAGLNAIVNTILFDGNKIYDLVVGDVGSAHRHGCIICREVYGVHVPEKADVVIAEAYPTDIDLRQAIKAICAADVVCRDGGVIILPAECPEGIAPQFSDFVKYGFKNPDRLYKDVETGKFKQKLMAYTLIAIGRIISKRVKAILVSPNIQKDEAENMGFLWAEDLQQAVDRAFHIVRKNAKILVLRRGGEILPIIK